MSLTIKTNIASLIAQGSLANSTNKLNQAIERMTTGLKINHASDNAANYSIATNMTTKINAYQIAEENVSMGLEMITTASDSLSLMSDMTSRLRALATQAHNGTYGIKSLNALNTEAQAIITELYRVRETASYNGIKLFNDFNSTAPTAANGTKLVPNEKGFLKKIVERDTSTMDRLEDVDATTKITGGTYSISTEEGFVKLAQMLNSNKISGACEFVLAADIDISKFCKSNLNAKGEGGWVPIFQGKGCTLDGNGHTISGLYINRPNSNNQGLFGFQVDMSVKNLGLINPHVTGQTYVGALRSAAYYKTPDNCYVEGGSVTGVSDVGGLVGFLNYCDATYCYTTCNVTGESYVGGISGQGGSVTNSYSSGDISGTSSVGGISGQGGSVTNSYSSGDISGTSSVGGITGDTNGSRLTNCAVYGTVNGSTATGIFVGNLRSSSFSITDSSYNTNVNTMLKMIGTGVEPVLKNVSGVNFGAKVNLQVGIDSSENSNVKFEAWFALDGLSRLQKTHLENDDVFDLIDGIMSQITKKQTEYGAVQNRLESALDEISTQYENLVSSRSTLRDADIADVSSEYINMQILQNASATLMSTANQTPALALQLL